MPSSCFITLTGHIGHVESLKDIGNFKLIKFSVALNTSVKNREGKYDTVTDWITCTVKGPKAEYVSKQAVTGVLVQVTGKLEGRHWTGKDNVERKALEITAYDTLFFPKNDGVTQPKTFQRSQPKPQESFNDDIDWS